jgi:hypothetical protein
VVGVSLSTTCCVFVSVSHDCLSFFRVLLRCVGDTSVVSFARAQPSRCDADEGPTRGPVKVPGRRGPRQLGQPAGVCDCVCVFVCVPMH